MKLIMCADDFGQSEAIDKAIIELIKKNRLSAASCMTLSPRWPSAAKKITPSIRKKASIGLHLDFTHFGDATSHPKLVLLSLARQLSKQRIKQSIHQQLDAFEAGLNGPPDYIDGHQHVHQLPQIRDVLLETLLQRYPKQLPWLRIAKPPVSDGIKGIVIRSLGANAFERNAKKLGFVCSGHLLGAYGFGGSREVYIHRFKHWINETAISSATPILMCHPATDGAEEENDVIYPARVREFSALTSDELANVFDRLTLVKSPAD